MQEHNTISVMEKKLVAVCHNNFIRVLLMWQWEGYL